VLVVRLQPVSHQSVPDRGGPVSKRLPGMRTGTGAHGVSFQGCQGRSVNHFTLSCASGDIEDHLRGRTTRFLLCELRPPSTEAKRGRPDHVGGSPDKTVISGQTELAGVRDNAR
jgi:hypothetical protein